MDTWLNDMWMVLGIIFKEIVNAWPLFAFALIVAFIFFLFYEIKLYYQKRKLDE